jgi:hypothetical protein
MRRFLHDFYNDVCVEYVRNTASAMGPTSRLLVCDGLVPDKVQVRENPEFYAVDLALMTLTGKEKTLEEFLYIFAESGLELVKIHELPYSNRTVMLEAKLKRQQVEAS